MPRFRTPFLTILVAVSLAACDEVPDLSLPNEPPQAVDDDIELLQDAAISIDVTANDIDIDGNVTLIELVSDAAHGTATVVDNLVRYTPDRLYSGADSFDYRITDSKGESDEATVALTVKQRQTRALFAADEGGVRTLYMVDSRQPDSLVNLSAALDAGESVRDWAYDNLQQEAVVLTDADRIVAIPLSDPAMAEFFPIDLAAGESVDDGFAIAPLAGRAAFSVNNRFLRTFELDDGTFESIDTGWTDSTMEVLFMSPVGTSALMTGTLGAPAVTAFYLVTIDGAAPVALFEGEDDTGTISARILTGTNQMVFVNEQPGVDGPGPFSCQNPPVQRLSSITYVPVLDSANSVDLNESSGVLPAMTDIISYNPSPTGLRVYVAACPPAADIVQLIEVPFATPATARVVATGSDASDGLFGVDVASDGLSLIYTVDGDTGLRPIRVDLSDGDPVATDLAGAVPEFQTFADGMDERAPASAISTDTRRWLFVAPEGGEPTLLTWLDIDEETTASVTLPFATTRAPISDGYLAFVSDATTAALVRLDGSPAIAVNVPGTLAAAEGALAIAPVVFAPVSLSDIP